MTVLSEEFSLNSLIRATLEKIVKSPEIIVTVKEKVEEELLKQIPSLIQRLLNDAEEEIEDNPLTDVIIEALETAINKFRR